MTAVQQVLDLPEVIEDILLRVDNKTLLLSQRVSKQFKASIEGSIRIQQKLFFRHPPPDPKGKDGDFADAINPLLPWSKVTQEMGFKTIMQDSNPTRGFGFSMEAGCFEGGLGQLVADGVWFITFNMVSDSMLWRRSAKKKKITESWGRMFLFRKEHVLFRLSFEWQGQVVGREDRPKIEGSDDLVKASETHWLGKMFEVCAKAKRRARANGVICRNQTTQATQKTKREEHSASRDKWQRPKGF